MLSQEAALKATKLRSALKWMFLPQDRLEKSVKPMLERGCDAYNFRKQKGRIKIAVNYSDHNPPHFHFIKGKKTIALVSIRDAVVIEGVLPRVLLHRVLG